MDNIEIRKANLEDLEEIQNLNNELFELELNNFDDTLIKDWPLSGDGKEYFEDAINNNIVIVVSIDNKIVGYLAGSLYSQYSYNKNVQAELDNMCINKEYRNKGIGKLLLDEFKKICADNNIDEIKVVASFKNNNAIEFYKNNGFEEAEVTLKMKI